MAAVSRRKYGYLGIVLIGLVLLWLWYSIPEATPRYGKFSCLLKDLHVQHKTETWPTAVADLYRSLVYVTAFSSNHFAEAKDMISSVQKCLPETKIIVYDIGLNSNQRAEVVAYCNVELRTFKFDKYKPYVRDCKKYAWKPIIIKEVSMEYDVIMYGDASLRFKSCDISSALAHLLRFPFLDAQPHPTRAIEFTDDGMMEYLHYPPIREVMAEFTVLQACAWLLWANDIMREKFLDPWLDCALHEECIAPQGAHLGRCSLENVLASLSKSLRIISLFIRHTGSYSGCHRYDQSALNLILAREFGLGVIEMASNKTISDSLWTICRQVTHQCHISLCSKVATAPNE